jgi:hypothetical protein
VLVSLVVYKLKQLGREKGGKFFEGESFALGVSPMVVACKGLKTLISGPFIGSFSFPLQFLSGRSTVVGRGERSVATHTLGSRYGVKKG